MKLNFEDRDFLETGQGIVMHFLNLHGDIHLYFGVNRLVVRFFSYILGARAWDVVASVIHHNISRTARLRYKLWAYKGKLQQRK